MSITRLLLPIASPLLLTGCLQMAPPMEPYLDVGIGRVIRSDGYETGCDPTVRVAAGISTAYTYVELAHSSNLTCGWPFNDRPETWFEEFRIGMRIK